MSNVRKNIVIPQKFFDRPTLDVAKDILGKFLVCKKEDDTIAVMITEVEAYVGPKDKASHASRGKTPRTSVMFGKPGYWYVYLIYGMHYCVNIVTEKEEYPAAILIRGVEGISGPGRVAKYFGIDKTFNAKLASKKSGLWIEDRGIKLSAGGGSAIGGKPRHIRRGKRIGVDYAGAWKDKLWRFYIRPVPL